MSPTARSLALLRRDGYLADVVERFLPRIERHRDCFGVADVLAVHPRDRAVLLVQATTAAHVPDRLRRIQGRPETRQLLAAGVLVEVWGWALVRDRWHVRRVALTLAELAGVEVQALPRRRRQRRGERQRDLFEMQKQS